jgi:hypothetical protein
LVGIVISIVSVFSRSLLLLSVIWSPPHRRLLQNQLRRAEKVQLLYLRDYLPAYPDHMVT